MIDVQTETLVSLSEAAKNLPRRRAGKRPHVCTLYRWSQRGCKGVLLETVQIGGTRCTSKEALARFFQRLTQDAGHDTPSSRTPTRRRREVEKASSELEREGL